MNNPFVSPHFQLFADSTKTINYKRDAHNYITQLFSEQMPAIKTGFFNVHLSKGIIIQPHWHPNAVELVYVISGEVMTSVFNPFSQQLITYHVKAGQVSQFPKGWFHWLVALENHTHLLTIFDKPTPDVVLGSDFLRFLPKEIANRAYCVNETAYANAVSPITSSVFLGPPPGCYSVDNQTPSTPYPTQSSATIHPYKDQSPPPYPF